VLLHALTLLALRCVDLNLLVDRYFLLHFFLLHFFYRCEFGDASGGAAMPGAGLLAWLFRAGGWVGGCGCDGEREGGRVRCVPNWRGDGAIGGGFLTGFAG
jgi:hypothetical protein